MDRLPQDVGGQGTIKTKNIETVDYSGPDGPFILTITGAGSGMVAKLYRTPDQDGGSNTLLTTSNSVNSDGNLLTSDGYNMFALSDTAASIPMQTMRRLLLGLLF